MHHSCCRHAQERGSPLSSAWRSFSRASRVETEAQGGGWRMHGVAWAKLKADANLRINEHKITTLSAHEAEPDAQRGVFESPQCAGRVHPGASETESQES